MAANELTPEIRCNLTGLGENTEKVWH